MVKPRKWGLLGNIGTSLRTWMNQLLNHAVGNRLRTHEQQQKAGQCGGAGTMQ